MTGGVYNKSIKCVVQLGTTLGIGKTEENRMTSINRSLE